VTASKATRPQEKHGGGGALQSYLTSLIYLRQEAKRDGLDAIADIMWGAVAAIERWLDTGTAPAHSPEVLNSSLCHSLDFLLHWRALPPARQREVARDIARYEEEISTDVALPVPRQKASRKTAN
jgi:hypothetical protein